jgi:hypothetical protein
VDNVSKLVARLDDFRVSDEVRLAAACQGRALPENLKPRPIYFGPVSFDFGPSIFGLTELSVRPVSAG